MSDDSGSHADLMALTADIVAAHVSNNTVSVGDMPALIAGTFAALAALGGAAAVADPPREPAVPVKNSVKSDHIVCLEDGKKLKMLKRHLMTRYNMTPEAIARAGRCRPTIRWSPPTMPPSAGRSRSRSASARSATPARGALAAAPLAAAAVAF